MGRSGYVTVRSLATIAVALAVAAAAVAGVSIYRGRAMKAQRDGMICLSPALADLMFRIGAGEQVTGVSQYARLPEGVNRPVVGDVMRVNRELILWLRPRAILIQQQPTDVLKRLAEDDGIPVEHFQIETLEDLRSALRRLDAMAGTRGSEQAISEIDSQLAAVREAVAGRNRPTVLLAIGRDPVMAAGKNTYLDELIEIAGGQNAVSLSRYPMLNDEEVARLAPQVIIDVLAGDTPPTPERLAARLKAWGNLKAPAVSASRVHVIHDPSVTIIDSHVARTARTLAGLLHPEAELGTRNSELGTQQMPRMPQACSDPRSAFRVPSSALPVPRSALESEAAP